MDNIKKTNSLYFWYFVLGLAGALGSFLLPVFIVQIGSIYEEINLVLTKIVGMFFLDPHGFDAISYLIIYSLPMLPIYLLSFFLPASRKQFKENRWFVLLSLLSYYSGVILVIVVWLITALLAIRG